MTAKLTYTTRKKSDVIPASEDIKGKFRDEFRKRNELYPYHLRIFGKDKTVVRHFDNEKEARYIFDQTKESTAILIKFNNVTGPKFIGYRYVR